MSKGTGSRAALVQLMSLVLFSHFIFSIHCSEDAHFDQPHTQRPLHGDVLSIETNEQREAGNTLHWLIRRQRNRNPKNKANPETSLQLEKSLIQEASSKDGKEEENHARSLRSKNNFINFCATSAGKAHGAVLMDGKQTRDRPACNPIVLGMIPAQDKLPSCKFLSPKNLDTLPAGKTFTVSMELRQFVSGKFTNPAKTYYAAPAQLDPATGFIIGHSHIVIQSVGNLQSTTPVDALDFAFFKGVDDAAKDGVVSVEVKDGLKPGVYRIGSLNTAANHQPIGSTLAQRGLLDDVIYITVT